MTDKNRELLERLSGKLIVSCQARVGWPMYGAQIMAAFARAAMEGGAAGIRATGADNIAAIKERVGLPIIGINKQFSDDYDVYITPTWASAREILEVGVDIIALDATPRPRPGGERLEDIVSSIRREYPDTLVMGEISTLDEARRALPMGFDLISTTLAGYTAESANVTRAAVDLVRDIVAITDTPVIAEGKVRLEQDAVDMLDAGALAVVVGTSITRPEVITSRYVEALAERGRR